MVEASGETAVELAAREEMADEEAANEETAEETAGRQEASLLPPIVIYKRDMSTSDRSILIPKPTDPLHASAPVASSRESMTAVPAARFACQVMD